MNFTRISGALFTVLGFAGILYASSLFVNMSSLQDHQIKGPIIYGTIGILFFTLGIRLNRTIKIETLTQNNSKSLLTKH